MTVFVFRTSITHTCPPLSSLCTVQSPSAWWSDLGSSCTMNQKSDIVELVADKSTNPINRGSVWLFRLENFGWGCIIRRIRLGRSPSWTSILSWILTRRICLSDISSNPPSLWAHTRTSWNLWPISLLRFPLSPSKAVRSVPSSYFWQRCRSRCWALWKAGGEHNPYDWEAYCRWSTLLVSHPQSPLGGPLQFGWLGSVWVAIGTADWSYCLWAAVHSD